MSHATLFGRTLQAVLFDFDGTLADSYSAIAASVNHVRSCRGLTPLAEPEVKRYVGRGALWLMEHTVPGSDPEANLRLYRAHHPSIMAARTWLLPGAVAALAALSAAGLRLGVCSNKPAIFTRVLLEALGVAHHFRIVLGPDDVPRPKPAPDMLREAMRQLDVAAERTAYVGDMTVDVESARAAGTTVWVVATGSDDVAALTAAAPDRVLAGLDDLVAGLTAPPRQGYVD